MGRPHENDCIKILPPAKRLKNTGGGTEHLFMNHEAHPLLEIQDLSVSFHMYDRGLKQRDLKVISDLHLTIYPGEVVAVAGSS